MSMSAPGLTSMAAPVWRLATIRLVLSSVSVWRGMRGVVMVDVKVSGEGGRGGEGRGGERGGRRINQIQAEGEEEMTSGK